MEQLRDSLLSLITETATNMPADVRRVLAAANHREPRSTQAGQALQIINLNIDMAKENVSPICQDTGMPTFQVHTPVGVNQIIIAKPFKTPSPRPPAWGNSVLTAWIASPARIPA